MAVFKDSKQFYETVGELMDRAKKDPNVGPKIAKSGSIIQFKYTEPDAVTTINAKDKPTQAGAFIDVFHGPTNLVPDIVMSMKADVSHAFWQGKVDLVGAIARKQMVIEKGALPKILKLVPAITPLFKIYPVLLKEKGLAAK
ncbi:MAG: hypothetical protein U0559_08255 [Anaerolineae bacterium]